MRTLACTPDGQHQYTSFVFTAHLIEAAVDASTGTVGDALDNALMESKIGLYEGVAQIPAAITEPKPE